MMMWAAARCQPALHAMRTIRPHSLSLPITRIPSPSSFLPPPLSSPVAAAASTVSLFHSAAPLCSPPTIDAPPTGPTFDAPLPTLAPVDTIDPAELMVDESTLARLASLTQKHGRPCHLRVLVDQGGCSGLEYKFSVEIDTPPQDDDIVLQFGSSSVYVDRDSWLWLRGSRIVYTQELARAAFVVSDNPNATQACGCKSSFAPKIDPRTNKPAALAM